MQQVVGEYRIEDVADCISDSLWVLDAFDTFIEPHAAMSIKVCEANHSVQITRNNFASDYSFSLQNVNFDSRQAEVEKQIEILCIVLEDIIFSTSIRQDECCNTLWRIPIRAEVSRDKAIPHDDLTHISFIISVPTKLIQSAQSVRKFGMYVGRLSPGEMGVKRGGDATLLEGGWLGTCAVSTCHSPTAACAPTRSNNHATPAHVRFTFTTFFFWKKICGTLLCANCVVIGTLLDFSFCCLPVLCFEDYGMFVDDIFNYFIITTLV